MKTVTGEIKSTKPISLSKASKILSKFVSTDTSVSSTVNVYLNRTLDSFNELTQFHKSKSKSDQKGAQKSKLLNEQQTDGKYVKYAENGGGNGDGTVGNYCDNGGRFAEVSEREEDVKRVRFEKNVALGIDAELTGNEGSGGVAGSFGIDGSGGGLSGMKHKKKKGKEGSGVGDDAVVDGSGDGSRKKHKKENTEGVGEIKDDVRVDGSGKKHKKKKDKEGSSGIGDDVARDGSGGGSGKKNKKDKGGLSGVRDNIGIDGLGEELLKKNKKRKVEEVEEGGEFDGPDELRRKKKKKSK